jgi:Proteolysis_6 C-terminal
MHTSFRYTYSLRGTATMMLFRRAASTVLSTERNINMFITYFTQVTSIATSRLGAILGGAPTVPAAPQQQRTSAKAAQAAAAATAAAAAWQRSTLLMPLQTVSDSISVALHNKTGRYNSTAIELRAGGAIDTDDDSNDEHSGAVPRTPAERVLAEQLLQTQAKGDSAKEAEIVWPLAAVPLLAWDLNTLVAALTSLLRTPAQRRQALRALCLARLAQILIQPEFCLTGTATANTTTGAIAGLSTASGSQRSTRSSASNSGNSSSSDSKFAAALSAQRADLAHTLGLPVSQQAPAGEALVQCVYYAWLPFLRTAALLLYTCNGDENEVRCCCK